LFNRLLIFILLVLPYSLGVVFFSDCCWTCS